jgi:hypothetical protein
MKSLVNTGVRIDTAEELQEFLLLADKAGWCWRNGMKPMENEGSYQLPLYFDACDGFGFGTPGNPSCPAELISLKEFKAKQAAPVLMVSSRG